MRSLALALAALAGCAAVEPCHDHAGRLSLRSWGRTSRQAPAAFTLTVHNPSAEALEGVVDCTLPDGGLRERVRVGPAQHTVLYIQTFADPRRAEPVSCELVEDAGVLVAGTD